MSLLMELENLIGSDFYNYASPDGLSHGSDRLS
jgi:hypothetical protein